MPYKKSKSKESTGYLPPAIALAVAALFPILSLTMSDGEQKIDLDLRGSFCPMAFVKLRLFADRMPHGAVIHVLYEDSAANEPLARSTLGIGHEVISDECYAGKLAKGGATRLKLMTVRVVK